VRLHDLLDGVGVAEWSGDPATDVRSVVHDSRAARPGSLFACIPGTTTDGHEHAGAAVGAGAVALLVERVLDLPVAQARVASVRAVLGRVAARIEGDPSRAMRVLGVTGTNGKTTTTLLIEAVARAAGEQAGVIGTLGASAGTRVIELAAQHTTPEATDLQRALAELRDASVETVAMEVSSHALAQRRVDGTWFEAVCFTNLTHDHLDFHGTMDAYFAAKARLFTAEFTGRAAVNVDDPRGDGLADAAVRAGLDVARWSASGAAGADVVAEHVSMHPDRTHLTLRHRRDGWDAEVASPLVGAFNVANLVGAAALAAAGGFDPSEIAAGLSADLVVPGRLEPVRAGQDFTVLVDYAHTPDALARVLEAARSLVRAGSRVIAVYGCGGDRDRDKRPAMGAAAARGADLAVLTSDNPRSEDPAAIAADVVRGVPADAPPVVELDRRAAIRYALGEARPGDVVVIAGKGHETGQTARGITVPFDDRLVAREELEARTCI
jgi:UDP-N-acetylmuramoyl-L-alanyl-D-glutamate--2,6-diaminopimelate ligase